MLDSEFLGTTNNREDRPGLGAHVRPRVQPVQADDRGRRGLRRRRRLRADDLLRLRHRRPTTPRSATSTSAARCSAAPARSTACRATSACARPRSCCSPASCCPARSARTGAWPTSPRRPTELEQAIADFVAPMIDKSAFTMRITKLAANRGLDGDTETLIALESMTCNVAHQSEDATEGVQAFLEKRDPVWTPPLSARRAWTSRSTPTTLELRERLLRVHGRVRVPRGAALPRGGRRRPTTGGARRRSSRSSRPRRASAGCGTCSCRRSTSTARA